MPAAGLPAGQVPGSDTAALGRCCGDRGAGAHTGEWGLLGSTAARGGSGPSLGPSHQLSTQLRQWHLRRAWRTWRQRVVRLRVARRLQQQGGWVLSQVLAGQPPPTPQQALPNLVPHLDISELWTLPACHRQAPLIFRGGVSLVRENSLDSGTLDLAGSPAQCSPTHHSD